MSKSTVRLRTAKFDDLCLSRGLISIADRCARMGISRAQMTKVRYHRSQPGPRFIHAALDVLGVPYAALFERTDERVDDFARAA